ncbi:MAG: hypothetical protein AAGA02_11895 [Bacteroidota bacterium]
MNIDLKNKKIILIHGLASKPPKEVLHKLWTKCLIENIRCSNSELATMLEKTPDTFESAYWANTIPHHIEDDEDYVKKLEVRVDEVIEARKEADDFHVGIGEKVSDFFKDKGVDLVKILAGALTVKDDVMKAVLRETELYDQDQYIADKIRRPLEMAIRSAWDENQKVVIISHSMGSFIAYDVLWRFSHRNVEEFEEYKNRRVSMFITMGSPLGDPTIQNLLFGKHHRKHGKRQYPTNIDFWHNYSCLGDVVSHQENFKNIFFEDMQDHGLLKGAYQAIDYLNLHNPFQVVSHEGNKKREKRNPHKSYGYLIQPRLGTWVSDFLQDEL